MPARRINTSPEPVPGAAPSPVGAVPVPAGAVPGVALYDVDPDVLAALVLACPAVAGLSGGPFGAAATYLPGRTVPGVRISPDNVEVHVVARYGPTVGELAGQVRAALAGVVLGRRVDIVVEDLDDGPNIGGTATVVTADAADPLLVVTPVAVVGGVDEPVEVLDVVEAPGTAPSAPPASRPSR